MEEKEQENKEIAEIFEDQPTEKTQEIKETEKAQEQNTCDFFGEIRAEYEKKVEQQKAIYEKQINEQQQIIKQLLNEDSGERVQPQSFVDKINQKRNYIKW